MNQIEEAQIQRNVIKKIVVFSCSPGHFLEQLLFSSGGKGWWCNVVSTIAGSLQPMNCVPWFVSTSSGILNRDQIPRSASATVSMSIFFRAVASAKRVA